jgi:hypothetical protein
MQHPPWKSSRSKLKAELQRLEYPIWPSRMLNRPVRTVALKPEQLLHNPPFEAGVKEILGLLLDDRENNLARLDRWMHYQEYSSHKAAAFCTSAGDIGVGLAGVRAGDILVAVNGDAPGAMVLHPHGNSFRFEGFVIMESRAKFADMEVKARQFVVE